jgi:hypothetical protein
VGLILRALSPNPIGVITTLLKKGLTATFFKKSLIKNSVTFGFESLIPKPYQRDQPAQRLRRNGCAQEDYFYDSFLYFACSQ